MFSVSITSILQIGCRVCGCTSKNETKHKAETATGNSIPVTKWEKGGGTGFVGIHG